MIHLRVQRALRLRYSRTFGFGPNEDDLTRQRQIQRANARVQSERTRGALLFWESMCDDGNTFALTPLVQYSESR